MWEEDDKRGGNYQQDVQSEIAKVPARPRAGSQRGGGGGEARRGEAGWVREQVCRAALRSLLPICVPVCVPPVCRLRLRSANSTQI
ncbi:hypothetical protein SKAU_G00122270 [Synaphobranchus kaupii]|uniref:Uncharacterized protein n=1 Tax=Synaphobranchus kaupii TaxID=118154 RepID=A0A9Q1J258_SYNKA|nr:hypothetical protein SKAU_G00122270 [Synaphobranchus kaupii]